MSLLFCLDIVKPLPEFKFAIILHAWTKLSSSLFNHFFFVFLFYCFQLKEKKKKTGGEEADFFFFLRVAFQIMNVFLPDILVHCALIDYAYI
jgi:hypothetical protein